MAELFGSEVTRIPRFSHPRKTAGLLVAVVLCIVAAFFLGKAVTTPTQRALREAPEEIQAYGAVEQRKPAPDEKLSGTVIHGQTHALGFPNEVGAVVTDSPLVPGQRVTSLQYLGAIAGVPQFAMNAGVPLYRDLKRGMTGNDVLMLQREFADNGFPGVVPTGNVDEVTLEAVRLTYSNQGLQPPGKTRDDTVFHYRDFVRFGDGTGNVVKAAPFASEVSKETPLVTVSTGGSHVDARATIPLADRITAGTPVRISTGSLTLPGVVAAVGDLGKDGSGALGRTITVTSSRDLSTISTSAPVTVEPSSADAPGPAVPLTALREEGGVQYVLAARSRHEQPRRVNVTVLSQSEGWAFIKPDSELPVGAVLWIP